MSEIFQHRSIGDSGFSRNFPIAARPFHIQTEKPSTSHFLEDYHAEVEISPHFGTTKLFSPPRAAKQFAMEEAPEGFAIGTAVAVGVIGWVLIPEIMVFLTGAWILASCSNEKVGCSSDQDCKRNRICVAGICKDTDMAGQKDGGHSTNPNSSHRNDGGCIPRTSKLCSNNNVHWQNSCGEVGLLYKECAPEEQCLEGECVTNCLDGDGDHFYSSVGCGTLADCNDNNAAINPAAHEACDGIDNDCDGSTDEECPCRAGQTQRCGTTDVGECQYGLQTCNDLGSWSSCEGNIEPRPELCDGKDNNCDGETDNGFNLGMRCTQGVGECATNGETICSPEGNGTKCSAVPSQPLEETCDGRDNDCDGETDEGRVCERIAFSMGTFGVGYRLYTMNINGEDLYPVTPAGYSDEIVSSWFPNGDKIAFSSNREGGFGSSPAIYTINRDGSDMKKVGTGTGMHPSVSPDGSKIAYDGIYVMNADGENRQQLTEGTMPSWSPDGGSIVFHSPGRISIINSDGSGLRSLSVRVYNPPPHPSWSPLGGLMVYVGDGANLHIIEPSGENDRRLAAIGLMPDWSPRGDEVVYADVNSRRSNLTIININTMESRIVSSVSSPEDELYPAWWGPR